MRRRVELGVCLGVLYSLLTFLLANVSHINHILGTELVFWICPAFWVFPITSALGSQFGIWLSTEALFVVTLVVGGLVGGLIGFVVGRGHRTASR